MRKSPVASEIAVGFSLFLDQEFPCCSLVLPSLQCHGVRISKLIEHRVTISSSNLNQRSLIVVDVRDPMAPYYSRFSFLVFSSLVHETASFCTSVFCSFSADNSRNRAAIFIQLLTSRKMRIILTWLGWPNSAICTSCMLIFSMSSPFRR